MKTLLNAGFLFLFLAGAASCSDQQALTSDQAAYASILNVTSDGLSTVDAPIMLTAMVETPDLLENELSVLQKMKEEEKLARDVYAALFQKWANPVFSRISTAENNHLYALVSLLNYYGAADTIVAEAGVFQNPAVQTLYTDLVTTGSLSLEKAFSVGALIEEMDIKDLQESSLVTTNTNILLVFENLERGSRNHLRSFNKQLTALGIVYSPVYITQEAFDEIVNSAIEKGKGYAVNCNGQGSGKGNRRGNGGGQHGQGHGNGH